MLKSAWILVFLCPLVACGDSVEGVPLVGAVSGEFEDEPYTLEYAVALDIDPQGDYAELDTFMVWMAEPEIDCSASFLDSYAAKGVYAYFKLGELQPGLRDPHSVDLLRVHSGGIQLRGRQGVVDITTIDELTVAGSIAMEDLDNEDGVLSVNGTFEIVRCEEPI